MKSAIYAALEVRRYPDRTALASAAAALVADAVRSACASRGAARVVFACGPSQDEFHAALVRHPITWDRVTVFHTDEYIGLRAGHPRSLRHRLQTGLLNHIGEPQAVHLLHGEKDPVHESDRYGQLLAEQRIDLVCLDIGADGRLVFNDPSTADFCDPQLMKIIELDQHSRQLWVNDGCFPTLGAVPTDALTITIPALLGARQISCIATGESCAAAVRDALLGPITATCPASVLRHHPRAVLHLDSAAASLLPP